MDLPGHPFWDFSLRVYSREAVAAACLALQNQHKANVNVLLFCCWAGRNGERLSDRQLDALLAAVALWDRQVVQALRALRRDLKTGVGKVPLAHSQALRQEIQQVEIKAEHIEQLLLAATASLAQAGVPDRTAATANLIAYLRRLGVEQDHPVLGHVSTLLDACF